jgi:hypothetical protein
MNGLEVGELCGELVCHSGPGWLDRLRCLARTAASFADVNPDDRTAAIAADVLANAAKEYETNCRLGRVPRKQW